MIAFFALLFVDKGPTRPIKVLYSLLAHLLVAQLPLRYNFYDRKSEDRYLRPGICNRASALQFLQAEKRKQIPATVRASTGCRYISGFIFWVGKQVPATAGVGIGCKYTLGFIFLMGKQVPATAGK